MFALVDEGENIAGISLILIWASSPQAGRIHPLIREMDLRIGAVRGCGDRQIPCSRAQSFLFGTEWRANERLGDSSRELLRYS